MHEAKPKVEVLLHIGHFCDCKAAITLLSIGYAADTTCETGRSPLLAQSIRVSRAFSSCSILGALPRC